MWKDLGFLITNDLDSDSALVLNYICSFKADCVNY